MTHPHSRANRDLSDYLDLALRLANLFPAVMDFETGEIGPDLWDEVVGNPPGTTPPRLEAWEAAIHPDDRPARDASWPTAWPVGRRSTRPSTACAGKTGAGFGSWSSGRSSNETPGVGRCGWL